MDDQLHKLAAKGELIAYFGYGSLVNPATHRTNSFGYANARLRGWQRRWTARPDEHPEPIALLTSSPDAPADAWLSGLLVFDHIDSLASLDAREAGYDRRTIAPDAIDVEGVIVPDGCPVYAYEGRPPQKPDLEHVILQSYLDAVLQGYAHRYGAAAVGDFITTTQRFDMPILRDRTTPKYPRPVKLSDDERVLIDDATAALNFRDFA
ncbi:MAG: gamma-glutamylcyclotransferase family protein [Ahrensia sp.]